MTTIETTPTTTLYRKPSDLIADVKIPDEYATLTDAELQTQVGTTQFNKQAHYIHINQEVEREARNLAFKKLTTLATTTESGKIELNDTGKAFVAKIRSTKCARKNCAHNLGQTYSGYGREKFKTTEDLGDNEIVREFAPYTFEKIVDASYGTTSAIKKEIAPRILFYIRTAQRPNEIQRLGYCSRPCQEIQERSNENKRPEVPSVIKATLKAIGFIYNNKQSDKKAALWTNGPNSTFVRYTFADETLRLRGAGIVDGRVTWTELGAYTLGQLGALIDRANAAVSKDVLEKTVIDNNAPSPAELEGLNTLIEITQDYLKSANTDLAEALAAVADNARESEERIIHAIKIAALEAKIVAYGQLLSRAEGRLENADQNWNRPTTTPLPWLLTEAQLQLAKGDESFEKRAAKFGVSL
jgi:hypothetical protein